MFAVIYIFKIKPGKENQFEESWNVLTKYIYKYENSKGSRLHKSKKEEYIAYAQWPSKERWKNAGNNLPKKADATRARMRQACIRIKTIHELEIIDDLLEK